MMLPLKLWSKAKLWIYRHLTISGKGPKSVAIANERLLICTSCWYRRGAKCGLTGCDLKVQAMGSKRECPKNWWDR